MKVKTEINIEIAVKAVLRGDELSLQASGTAPYGDRTATATVEITDAAVVAAVKAALGEALGTVLPKLAQEAYYAASLALVKAVQLGEM